MYRSTLLRMETSTVKNKMDYTIIIIHQRHTATGYNKAGSFTILSFKEHHSMEKVILDLSNRDSIVKQFILMHLTRNTADEIQFIFGKKKYG